jgi:HlyD family secretion protein
VIKWASIILAIVGVAVGIWTVAASRRLPPQLVPLRPPPANPFAHGLAASGIVEASTRNIRIAASEPGLVTQVNVRVGDRVKAGDILFQLDSRALDADLARSRSALEVAQQQLARLESMPRKEDVPPLRAALQRVEAQLATAKNDRDSLKQMHIEKVATDVEMRRADLAVQEAEARRTEMQAELDRVLAGAWKSDVAVARANVEQARADIAAIQTRMDRLSVRSPVDGIVLKRLIEPGEYSSPLEGPSMQVGDISVLHVRAQVDERDTPLLRPGAAAVAVLVSEERHSFKLTMLRIEPLAIPKRNLTGRSTELVDTRVVEALFKVEPDPTVQITLYPGQVVDVYIDAGEAAPPKADPPAN